MIFPQEQIQELKCIYPNVFEAQEGGVIFFLLPNLSLPEGCMPNIVDALLCPTIRDGYNSRLFFSEKIVINKALNWNGNVRILEKSWLSISWQTKPGLRLIQMVSTHLDAFRQ